MERKKNTIVSYTRHKDIAENTANAAQGISKLAIVPTYPQIKPELGGATDRALDKLAAMTSPSLESWSNGMLMSPICRESETGVVRCMMQDSTTGVDND